MKLLWRYTFRIAVALFLLAVALLVISHCERKSKIEREEAAARADSFEKNRAKWAELGAPLLEDYLSDLKFTDTVAIQKRLSSEDRVLICGPVLSATFLDDDGQTTVADLLSLGQLSGAIGARLRWFVRATHDSSPLFAGEAPGTVNGCIVVDLSKSATVKSDRAELSFDINVRGVTSGEIYDFESPPSKL